MMLFGRSSVEKKECGYLTDHMYKRENVAIWQIIFLKENVAI